MANVSIKRLKIEPSRNHGEDVHDSAAHPYVELHVLISDRFDIESDSWNRCDGLIKLELI